MQIPIPLRSLSSLTLAGALLLSSAAAASAGFRHHRTVQDFLPDASSYRWITVNSEYGNAPPTISAPVRPGPTGMQVYLPPRGPWVNCGANCFDTLRRQTIDFWERWDN